ncbi:MAG: pyridoxal-dependent decarboxylase [Butyrivibrio sp.]|nr:pyridoxal-dependent decarboxylase [Butyrivibrio sp.]
MKIDSEIIKNIKAQYGEAFYLIDAQQFRRNFSELKNAFSSIYDNFNIAYSYKTNYAPTYCKLVKEMGGYAEVVSEMEMELAVKCGVEYENIIWNGPVKDKEMLREYLFNGGVSNIDNIDEAEYIRSLAEQNPDKLLNVGIRCNFDVDDGVVSRFGFDIDGEDFKKTIEIIKNTVNLHFVNFQCHFAKRQIEYWPNRAKGMINLIDRLGLIPERIDIGGGLFGKMPEELKSQFGCKIPSYDEYAAAVAKDFANYFKDKNNKPELIIEPGSAIVGDCMKFVCTVKSIKEVRGKNFATVLGSQKNISMTGVNPPIEIISMNEDAKAYDALDIVGYTCIEGDVLYKNYSGRIATGDIVVIHNCGSYSLVMKPPFILPNFPVIEVNNDSIKLVKRAESIDDIFSTFII